MKKTMRLIALLLACVMLVSTLGATLIACGEEDGSEVTPQHTHTYSSAWVGNDEGHWHPATCEHANLTSDYQTHSFKDGSCSVCGRPEPTTPPTQSTYNITVTTIGGMPLSNVTVFVVNDANPTAPVAFGTTDSNGTVALTFAAEQGAGYTAMLTSVPKGYNNRNEGYKLLGKDTPIVLESSVIPAETENDYKNESYELGDIMYDFSFKTVDGRTLRLSELLKGGKKGVLLNFWYTTCKWCLEEFPGLEAVYERYKDDISVIAIDPLGETDAEINSLVSQLGLTFDIVNGGQTLAQCFGLTGYPTSVFIDRYGTITFLASGGLPQRIFEALFSKSSADDYKQVIYETKEQLLPREECNIEMESSETIGGVLNSGEINVTYYPETESSDWKYSWPFATTEKDGYPCVKPMNSMKDESFATMHADVYLEENQALIFDFWSATEYINDVMYVLVDGVDIVAISGDNNEWRTCCAYVAKEAGTYKVTFIYAKDDSDNVSDDAVYIKSLRAGSVDDIKTPSYIQREAATKPYSQGFKEYITPVLGDDGYYHVNSATGPLLLADLMSYTNFSSEDSIYTLAANGKIVKNGKDYYNELLEYFSYASNSSIYGLCTVNEELAELLKITADVAGEGLYNENDWLEICKYYDAYGTGGKELVNPIQGLAPQSAFPTVENTESDPDDYYPNKVSYDRIIMPRGLYYEFIPTKSGVYRITSNSLSEVDGWIFDENRNELLVYDNIERLWTDYSNVSMVYYMEAGEKYYIDIAFHEVTEMGEFSFKIEYVGESFKLFAAASPGYFSSEIDESGNITGVLFAGGIDVALGDDGYYHELFEDGTLGEIVYADFTMYTAMFPTGAIYNYADPSGPSLINQGSFNFVTSALDNEAISKGYDKMTDDELRALWGEKFEENFALYQIADLRLGIYHGDYTERMLEIVATKMLDGTSDPNLGGCVAVDEELAMILQALIDSMSFSGVKNSWTKVCYCYRYYGPQKA